MSTILIVAGLFAGIGVFLSAMYSLSQLFLMEGRAQAAHGAMLVMILVVMALLLERYVDYARYAAVPLFLAATWCLIAEERWFRIFPLLVQIFSAILILGYVALT
jgi:hypothetical protein